ncbi:MAG TPA: hypothetical protein VF595_09645 [Tepidisphaeraceae bacterium]|jgi:hypothetical protein
MSRRPDLTLPLLLLLTLVAGVLRFVALDRPTIWGDEAATYGRVAGKYEELLNQLADSSFPPLHYQLEWWVGQGLPYWGHFEPPATPGGHRVFVPSSTHKLVPGGIPLTPFALRFIPALAGTLFVPAVYFLAVQLFGRRVALTAAFLACFSAYNLVYSRDAKMYMHFWLCATLHVGCALWWMRTRRPLAWAFWLLTGVVTVGLHGSGFVVLAIDALIVFTSPHQHWRHLYTLLPAVFWSAAVGPARGIEWVRRRRGFAPRDDWLKIAVWRHRAVRRFRWPLVVGFMIGLAMMLATAFGPLGYYSAFSRDVRQVAESAGTQVDLGDLGIGWVGAYNRGRELGDFLLYTASAYLTGWEWPRNFPGDNDQALVHPRTLLLLQGATVGLLALLAVGLVPWRRVFAPVRSRLDRIRQDGRVAPAFRSRRVLWLAVWLTALPWVTYTQSVPRPANVLDAVARLVLVTPPTVQWPRATPHRTAALAEPSDVPTSSSDLGGAARSAWARTTTTITTARAVVSRSATEIAEAWPAAWTSYTAAFRRDNVSVGKVSLLGVCLLGLGAMWAYARRRLWRGTVRLTAAIIVLVVVGSVVNLLPRRIDDIIWMPRYLGTILPAVWVLVAVLIDRQPARLRWATLSLFVAVNLAQFSGRVWAGSEPPTALMAADVVAAQSKSYLPTAPEKPTFRAYTELNSFRMAEPGGGTLFSSPGRYYLRLLSGQSSDVRQIRYSFFGSSVQTWRPFGTPATVATAIDKDLRASPQIDRFVVWSGLPTGAVDQTDPLADLLKGRFKRVNEEVWVCRDHWRWVERFQVRRRTYQRTGEPEPSARPATQPATRPATRPTPPAVAGRVAPAATRPATRPAASRPSASRPSTRPASRPATAPATLPATRPAA